VPFWSPDGRSLGFIAGRTLKRLDLGGGQPQTLAPLGNGAVGTWGANDIILLVRGPANGIEKISATGGEPTDATGMPAQSAPHRWPQFMPDGKRFLFVASPATGVTTDAQSGTYLGALDGKPPVRLSTNTSRFVYLPSGWLLWLRAGALVAQRIDVDKPALIGPIVTVADNVAAMSVSNTGLIAYRQGESSKLQLKWVDRSGKVLGSVGEPDETNYSPRVAPDGRRIALARVSQGNRDIWLLDGERMTRLSYKPQDDEFPVWSPDGSRIVYTAQQTNSGDLFQRLAGAAGEGELFQGGGAIKFASSWSADGKFLLFFTPGLISAGQRNNLNIWVRPLTGDQKPYRLHESPFSEVWAQFSPDGKWVAYQSDESGRDEIYVRAFAASAAAAANPGANSHMPVSTAGGMHPMWRADGKELFYINPSGEMMAASIAVKGAQLTPGTPVRLFQTNILGGGTDNATGRQYDLAPDGRFLINSRLDSGVTSPITLIQNWTPEAGK
jgi:Tol biopolymer transport system component